MTGWTSFSVSAAAIGQRCIFAVGIKKFVTSLATFVVVRGPNLRIALPFDPIPGTSPEPAFLLRFAGSLIE